MRIGNNKTICIFWKHSSFRKHFLFLFDTFSKCALFRLIFKFMNKEPFAKLLKPQPKVGASKRERGDLENEHAEQYIQFK